MAFCRQFQVRAFALTDVGRTRDSNEDYLLVADLSQGVRIERSGYLRFFSGPYGALFAVADGMGGAAAGEMASRMCVKSLYREVQESILAVAHHGDNAFERILIEAVGISNRRVFDSARGDDSLAGMGTTLTVVLQSHDHMIIGQIGDSRAYHLCETGILQLTRDQSLVGQKISAGELTEAEARRHPERNILLQAVGVRPQVELVLRSMSLEPGDILLLCSDGLHAQMSNDEIFDVVTGSRGPDNACAALVDLANQRGGPDNITVVLVHFVPE
ncbi:MAG: serine/threonine-protein phosphatase [Acidobacteria bacterium]|nr:serine/threonine-protein phosphatase [Acidobacteriota bacterium]